MLKIQKDVKKYLKERNWDKLAPADISKGISIEANELLEHFQWGNPTVEEIKKDKEKFKEIQSEVSDVFIYCLEMADRLGFDLEKVAYEKLEKVKIKYPAKLFKENKALPGTDLYWKIKSEYRKQNKK